jgi:hypothetical protein
MRGIFFASHATIHASLTKRCVKFDMEFSNLHDFSRVHALPIFPPRHGAPSSPLRAQNFLHAKCTNALTPCNNFTTPLRSE